MLKTTKFFVLVLALVLVGFSLFYVFVLSPLTNKQVDNSDLPGSECEDCTTEETESVKPINIISLDNRKFEVPVDEKYFENAYFLKIGGLGQSMFVAFYLDNGTEIKSIFDGRVSNVFETEASIHPLGDEPKANSVWVVAEDGLEAEYYFIGEILVKRNDKILTGDVLGKAGSGELASRKNANLSLALRNKEGDIVNLSRDLFFKN